MDIFLPILVIFFAVFTQSLTGFGVALVAGASWYNYRPKFTRSGKLFYCMSSAGFASCTQAQPVKKAPKENHPGIVRS